MTNSGDLVDEITKSGIPQAELAEISGVSRIQINRIVNSRVTRVRPSTAGKIRSAIDIARSGGGVLDRYRRLVRERLGKKSFVGLGIPGLPEQDLRSVYVTSMSTPAAIAGTHDCAGEKKELGPSELDASVARQRYEQARQRGESISVDSRIISTPRLVLLGCPGSGKTTVLKNAAVNVAEGTWLDGRSVPVFVRLPEFAEALKISASADLVDWIDSVTSEAGCHGLGPELRAQLDAKDKTVLFLFDGLDEVIDQAEQDLVRRACLDFINRYPRNRYCITSRPIGFDHEPWVEAGFQIANILELGDEQINEAIQKWSKVQRLDLNDTAGSISAEIRENPRLRQIAANPMVLTILFFLRVCRGYSLPRRRVELYGKIAEVFLESWEASKKHPDRFNEIINIDLDRRELAWLIADLALEMQRRGLVFAKRWWIEDRIVSTLINRIGFERSMARDATSRILRFISERSGLFEERALDLFAFSHRTLQEYFAALGIIDEADYAEGASIKTLIGPFRYHPDWPEVVRLVASNVSPPKAESLLRLILDDPDPSGRFLHRGPLLALDCLLDGATVANRDLAGQIFKSFDGLASSPWLGITMEALDRLQRFAESRNADLAFRAIDRILDHAKASLEPHQWEALYCCIHPLQTKSGAGVSGADANDSAVVQLTLENSEVTRVSFIPNVELYYLALDRWMEHARTILADDDVVFDAKEAVLSHLGSNAKIRQEARRLLSRTLRDHSEPMVRAEAAWQLCRFAKSRHGGLRTLLLKKVRDDESTEVRSACLAALRGLAKHDKEVRDVMIRALEDRTNLDVMRSAARGLRDIVVDDPRLLDSFIENAESINPEPFQIPYVQGLEVALRTSVSVRQKFAQWVGEDRFRARVAAQLLAAAFADGEIEWESIVVTRVEETLRSIGAPSMDLGKPCPHALYALTALVEARESKGGLRVESVLVEALSGLASKIQYAFVFGSVARNGQSDVSDIDLMLIGDLSMREIAPVVRRASEVLGRDVNPVIYDLRAFTAKLHCDDPFVTEVVRDSKIPLSVGGTPGSVEELNSELRTIGAERKATS